MVRKTIKISLKNKFRSLVNKVELPRIGFYTLSVTADKPCSSKVVEKRWRG